MEVYPFALEDEGSYAVLLGRLAVGRRGGNRGKGDIPGLGRSHEVLLPPWSPTSSSQREEHHLRVGIGCDSGQVGRKVTLGKISGGFLGEKRVAIGWTWVMHGSHFLRMLTRRQLVVILKSPFQLSRDFS